jgi:Leucine-rich repeat (LRR) protein
MPFESPFDAALEEDIRAHLGGLKGPITNDLLETLSFLNTTGAIQSLSGIDRLINLEALFIRFSSSGEVQGFSDITPLSSLRKLKVLTVRDTPLESLVPLGGMLFLEELNLPNAGISDLESLANLRRLKFLNLAENSVVDLSPLRDLDQLTTLNLTNNEVTDLSPLLDLAGLKSVWVRGNTLSEDTQNNVIPILRDRGAYVIGP